MRQVQPNLAMPAFQFQNQNPMALPPPPLLPPPPQPQQAQGMNPMAAMMAGMKMDPSALMGLFAPGANPLSPGMGAKLTNVPGYGPVGSLHGMLGRV